MVIPYNLFSIIEAFSLSICFNFSITVPDKVFLTEMVADYFGQTVQCNSEQSVQ